MALRPIQGWKPDGPGIPDLALQSGWLVYLRARPETLVGKLWVGIRTRPWPKSESELFSDIISLMEKKQRVYEKAHMILDTDTLIPADVAEKLAELLDWRLRVDRRC